MCSSDLEAEESAKILIEENKKLKSIADDYEHTYTQIERINNKLKIENTELFDMLKTTYAIVRSNKILKIDLEWIKRYGHILEKLEGNEMVFNPEDLKD